MKQVAVEFNQRRREIKDGLAEIENLVDQLDTALSKGGDATWGNVADLGRVRDLVAAAVVEARAHIG